MSLLDRLEIQSRLEIGINRNFKKVLFENIKHIYYKSPIFFMVTNAYGITKILS